MVEIDFPFRSPISEPGMEAIVVCMPPQSNIRLNGH
jgi:hypothetical protein